MNAKQTALRRQIASLMRAHLETKNASAFLVENKHTNKPRSGDRLLA
jgi:hypothetical protein